MIWARWAGVMGVPTKWEIARIFVVGTGGGGFCAEAARSGMIGLFMAVAPLSIFWYFGVRIVGPSWNSTWLLFDSGSARGAHLREPRIGTGGFAHVCEHRLRRTSSEQSAAARGVSG